MMTHIIFQIQTVHVTDQESHVVITERRKKDRCINHHTEEATKNDVINRGNDSL